MPPTVRCSLVLRFLSKPRPGGVSQTLTWWWGCGWLSLCLGSFIFGFSSSTSCNVLTSQQGSVLVITGGFCFLKIYNTANYSNNVFSVGNKCFNLNRQLFDDYIYQAWFVLMNIWTSDWSECWWVSVSWWTVVQAALVQCKVSCSFTFLISVSRFESQTWFSSAAFIYLHVNGSGRLHGLARVFIHHESVRAVCCKSLRWCHLLWRLKANKGHNVNDLRPPLWHKSLLSSACARVCEAASMWNMSVC